MSTNQQGDPRKSFLEPFFWGSISSAATTVIYQPLELLKTRIQLRNTSTSYYSKNYLGKLTQSAIGITKEHSIGYLWRGTGASLLRSVPGVGLYYASLSILQTSLSSHERQPDNPAQAFYFGLVARSTISLTLIPVTVVKVRYESGFYNYTSLFTAVKDAYLRSGWIGSAPTILRDSLFSGIYYMSYTYLKTRSRLNYNNKGESSLPTNSLQNFLNGCISGLLASIITNPFDVVKTNIQASTESSKSIRSSLRSISSGKHGHFHLLDGLVPRTLRRTLIAATTWTFYECLMTKR